MNMYDNVIVVDYDGCAVSWEHGFHMWMYDNGYETRINGFYEIHDTYEIPKKEAEALVRAFNESAALSRLPPLKDAIKYIRKLHEDHGYVFHCISAIPNTRDMYDSRMQNIHNLFGRTAFEKLTLCDSSKNKGMHLERYTNSGCYWIEDLQQNSLLGLEYGLNCILIDHHYNQGFSHPEIQRVKNWKEIYEIITG